MLYRKTEEAHFTRLTMTGRLTGLDGEAMRAAVEDVMHERGRRCLADLTGLDFIDSAGIGMLLVLNAEALAAGKTLALLVGKGQVERVVSLTRIAMIVPVYTDVADYLAVQVPEAILAARHPCAPGENPLAVAARALTVGAA